MARRTWACDRMVAEVTTQRRLLPRHLPPSYVRQMTAPHRITDTTKRGQKVGRYVSERADDYFFAETFDLLARAVRPGGVPAGAWSDQPLTMREQIRRGQGLFH